MKFLGHLCHSMATSQIYDKSTFYLLKIFFHPSILSRKVTENWLGGTKKIGLARNYDMNIVPSERRYFKYTVFLLLVDALSNVHFRFITYFLLWFIYFYNLIWILRQNNCILRKRVFIYATITAIYLSHLKEISAVLTNSVVWLWYR